MNVLKISDLIPHPKNDYFFDDVSGEKWERLLESIKRNGVRTPIIVTDNMVIVSGNQRVRACKELGILTINGEVVHYANDNDIIRDLIEINIRQRGVIDDSEIKQGRRFRFLQDYYGVQHGGDRKSESRPNNSVLKSQKQIADESGISVDTMNNYIKLSEMIPEMQELLESGTVTKTTALSIARKLSPEEQKQLAEQLIGKDKVSGSEVQKYIEENQKLRSALSESEAKRIAESGQVKEVVREVEVIPADYDELKEKASRIDSVKSEAKFLQGEFEKMAEKWKKAEAENDQLRKKLNEPEEKMVYDTRVNCYAFCSGVKAFLDKYGGVKYSKREIDLLPEREREAYMFAVRSMRKWIDDMLDEVTLEV